MSEQRVTPTTSAQLARTRLIHLKRRLTDLKLEALRRGYGLEPEDATALDDLDAVVAEVAEDVERFRRNRGGGSVSVDEIRWTGNHSTSSRA